MPTIFLSVQKAQTAPAAEITKAFGKDATPDEIRQEILLKGEVQVGERERKEMLDRVEREVLDIVSSRLVDPVTKRVYTSGMISKALDQLTSASGQLQLQAQQREHQEGESNNEDNGAGDENHPSLPPPPPSSSSLSSAQQPRKPLWAGVVPHKSAKSQALDAMKALIAWQPIPVMRARMRLRVTCPVSLLKQPVKSGPSHESRKEAVSAGAASKTSGKKGRKPAKGKQSGQNGSDAESGASDAEAASKTPGNVKDKILSFIESVESQEVVAGSDEWEVVGFAEPGAFKGLNEFVGNETRGRGKVEVLDMAITHEDD